MNIKLYDVLNLHYELNGLTKTNDDNQTEVVSVGLLKQKMSLKFKIYLQRLNNIVLDEMKIYEELKKELFGKYGEEKDGSIFIKPENFQKFNIEHNDLLSVDKNIDIKNILGESFDLEVLANIETDEYYPVLFTLLDSNKSKPIIE